MSTFDGFVKEFPNVRIDYFRFDHSRPPPAACFLSHVHSDHLQGLDTLKMPFVYCSAASKRLLLKLEKYTHRISFAKGILEARKQHYRHLRLVLRALPLQTPVELDLSPRSKIQVTLFDANHCPGSVMFLIEGSGNAILYTGDVRAEPWFVNSVIQNPLLLPHVGGKRTLDCIYLDTTFASSDEIYNKFPTKAEGIQELLKKVSKYPKDTIFYFKAWTLGYENVWLSLAKALNSRVHVDEYRFRLFQALVEPGSDGFGSLEGWPLAGFRVGNQEYSGCLTNETDVQIHSCEAGSSCHVSISKNKQSVHIIPVVSRLDDGSELREPGAGEGKRDFSQSLEMDLFDITAAQALQKIGEELIDDADLLSNLHGALVKFKESGFLSFPSSRLNLPSDSEISLKDFVNLVAHQYESTRSSVRLSSDRVARGEAKQESNNNIYFPYSRHSSYSELRLLVSKFQPKDICPCTVEVESWSEAMSVQNLFGDLCSEKVFFYDQKTREKVEKHYDERRYDTMRKPKRDDSISQDNDTQSTQIEGDSQEI